jgi:hypothetical protein
VVGGQEGIWGPQLSAVGQLPGLVAGHAFGIPVAFAATAALAGLTGVFQLACYTGFAAPNILSLLQDTISAPVLLLGAAALAALTLAPTTWQAQHTAA